MSGPVITLSAGVQARLSPDCTYYFWSFLLLALGTTTLAAANWRHPYWTAKRAVARLVLNFMGGAPFCALLRAEVVT